MAGRPQKRNGGGGTSAEEERCWKWLLPRRCAGDLSSRLEADGREMEVRGGQASVKTLFGSFNPNLLMSTAYYRTDLYQQEVQKV
ncbi:hypothetical protein L1887_03502 [Cichorium endivia]|nr:hypothetical protein L1887_03502 [Cichorium endivia]